MATASMSEGIGLPDGRRVRVVAYDDGAVRFRLAVALTAGSPCALRARPSAWPSPSGRIEPQRAAACVGLAFKRLASVQSSSSGESSSSTSTSRWSTYSRHRSLRDRLLLGSTSQKRQPFSLVPETAREAPDGVE